jgi:hypothetical protein
MVILSQLANVAGPCSGLVVPNVVKELGALITDRMTVWSMQMILRGILAI